jgi:hypothetical protein
MAESINAPIGTGSNLKELDTTSTLAAAGTKTYNVNTQGTDTLVVDVYADQACTLVITPVLDADETAADKSSIATNLLGPESDEGSITASTAAGFSYETCGAPRMLVEVTNDGASATTTYTCSIRGQV